jgi:hypothetical protein
MTTLSVCARSRKAKPAPVAKTTIVFDATQRHPAPRDFGCGLLRSVPTVRRTRTSQDEVWAAREFDAADYHRQLEERFIESVRLDSYERGILPL